MKNIFSNPWQPALLGVLLIALTFVIAVLGIYATKFNGALSTDPGDWGVFGDYVGGTLNPIFAFLSFIALLATLFLQGVELRNSTAALKASAEELRQSREIAEQEAKRKTSDQLRTDLFKVVHLVHTELDSVFDRFADFSPSKRSFGHYFSSSAPSKDEADIPSNGSALSPSDRTAILDIFERVSELDIYLNQYESMFGTSAVTYYFRRRYTTARNRLVSKGYALDAMWPGFRSPGFGWSINLTPETDK